MKLNSKKHETTKIGWRVARLADVCKVFNGTTPDTNKSEYWNGEIVWVTPTDLGKLKSVRIGHSARRISQAGFDSGNLTLVRPGSVIVSSRAPIGHLAIADVPLCTNQGCKSLVPSSEVVSEYLYFAMLRSVDRLRNLGSGATFTEVSKSQVENFEVQIAPLAEQQRIAAELTTAMAAVEHARRAAHERLAATEALPAAYLREVFDVADCREWSEYALADLVQTPIHTGVSKPGRPDSEKRCLSLSAVRGRLLLLEANKPADVSDSEAEGNWVKPGCFYVVRGNGNRNLVGRGAFAPDKMPSPVLFPDLLFQVDLNESVDPLFFWCLWCSASVRSAIEKLARTAAGIYKINTANLNALRLKLPAIDDQRRIAAKLSHKLSDVERLVGIVHEELSTVEALPAALLRQAFGANDTEP